MSLPVSNRVPGNQPVCHKTKKAAQALRRKRLSIHNLCIYGSCFYDSRVTFSRRLWPKQRLMIFRNEIC